MNRTRYEAARIAKALRAVHLKVSAPGAVLADLDATIQTHLAAVRRPAEQAAVLDHLLWLAARRDVLAATLRQLRGAPSRLVDGAPALVDR